MNKRNANFELLRVVSMMMIVMLHLLGNDHGNVLSKTQEFSAAWVLTWGLEALCTVAVNCYVLLSGYFLVGAKDLEDIDPNGKPLRFHWRKVLDICVTVWFYTFVFFIIGYVLGWVGVSRTSLLHLVTPITGRTYWFVSVYLGMYILSPYINKLIKSLSEIAHRRLILVCIALFSVLPTILPIYDTFQSGGGIGLVWFVVLYLIASYLRLYGIGGLWIRLEKWRSRQWGLAYLVVTLGILTSKIVISVVTQKLLGHTTGTSILYQYYTPTCLLSAVCLFMTFKHMNLTGESMVGRLILLLSPLMFGVYIIHENPSIKGKMWELVSPGIEGNVVVLILKLFGIVLGITVTCMAIEWGRQMLFSLMQTKEKQSKF